MDIFFEALNEYLKSDLAKTYGGVILIAFIICVCIVGFIIWVIFDKLIYSAKLIEANNAINDYGHLKEENNALKEEVKSLKENLAHYKILQAMEGSPDADFHDKALKKFIH